MNSIRLLNDDISADSIEDIEKKELHWWYSCVDRERRGRTVSPDHCKRQPNRLRSCATRAQSQQLFTASTII